MCKLLVFLDICCKKALMIASFLFLKFFSILLGISTPLGWECGAGGGGGEGRKEEIRDKKRFKSHSLEVKEVLFDRFEINPDPRQLLL